MKRSRGISLTEYGLIAGIIALVALPVLFKLSEELSNSTLSIIPAQRKASVSVATGSANIPVANIQAMKTSPTIPPISILADMPPILSTSDLTTTIQTVGVNGTTTLLADSLVTLSNKLKEEGSIDDDTYNAIAALANQGHSLAKIEASIEIAAKAAGDGGGSAFDRAKAELNGKPYSGPQLVAMLNSTGSDINAFRDLQSKVLNGTSIKDPAVKSIISQLSNNILNVADASATSGDWISRDGGGINSYDSFTEDFPEMIADYAQKTTVNSNDICSTQHNTAICTQ